jgi:hypothetical protein
MIKDLDLAHATDIYNAVPSKYVDIAVTTSAVAFNLNKLGTDPGPYVNLGGKRVRLRAQGGAVTILGGDHTGGTPMAAGEGLVLAQDALSERFFVPQEDFVLTVRASGSFTLRVFYAD